MKVASNILETFFYCYDIKVFSATWFSDKIQLDTCLYEILSGLITGYTLEYILRNTEQPALGQPSIYTRQYNRTVMYSRV